MIWALLIVGGATVFFSWLLARTAVGNLERRVEHLLRESRERAAAGEFGEGPSTRTMDPETVARLREKSGGF